MARDAFGQFGSAEEIARKGGRSSNAPKTREFFRNTTVDTAAEATPRDEAVGS